MSAESIKRAYLRVITLEKQELDSPCPNEGILFACLVAKRNLAPLLRDSFVGITGAEKAEGLPRD